MNSSTCIKVEEGIHMNITHWMHQVLCRGSRPHFNLFTSELPICYNRGFIITQNEKMGKDLILKITQCLKGCVEMTDFVRNTKCCAKAVLQESLSSWHCPWEQRNTTAVLTSIASGFPSLVSIDDKVLCKHSIFLPSDSFWYICQCLSL